MASEYWAYNRTERKWIAGPFPTSQAASDHARRVVTKNGETSKGNAPISKVTIDVVTTTAP